MQNIDCGPSTPPRSGGGGSPPAAARVLKGDDLSAPPCARCAPIPPHPGVGPSAAPGTLHRDLNGSCFSCVG
uniref:Uncharacterized protein n=1 Tax=Setaria italica TaxID=4555 RepID=K4A2W8_SETIT